MAWDFSTDLEFQEKLDWVEQFCTRADRTVDLRVPRRRLARRPSARGQPTRRRAQGPGQGAGALGHLPRQGHRRPRFRTAQARAPERDPRHGYGSAPAIFGCQAPDTGNMEILATYGTEEQKKKYLEPLFAQKMRSCYSMTEPQGGSDPTLFVTHAERDGDEWVINGEKWFTQLREVRRHPHRDVQQRDVHRREGNSGHRVPGGRGIHAHIRYNDVRIPPRTCSVRKAAPTRSRNGVSAAVASTTRCAR